MGEGGSGGKREGGGGGAEHIRDLSDYLPLARGLDQHSSITFTTFLCASPLAHV